MSDAIVEMGDDGAPTTFVTYRMDQEQIDNILSWVIPETDQEPIFAREKDRGLTIKTTEVMNKSLVRRRKLQAYVKDNLEQFSHVDINEDMFYS
uniref:Uncharacterized protein n=1 Tax=Leersia perrieri TaxID=77586 RepID=A0A0D9XRW2_9ORYZ